MTQDTHYPSSYYYASSPHTYKISNMYIYTYISDLYGQEGENFSWSLTLLFVTEFSYNYFSSLKVPYNYIN